MKMPISPSRIDQALSFAVLFAVIAGCFDGVSKKYAAQSAMLLVSTLTPGGTRTCRP